MNRKRLSGTVALPLFAAALVAQAGCGKQTFLAAAFVQTPAVPGPPGSQTNIPAYALMTAYLGTIDTTDPTKIDASKVAAVTGAAALVYFHSALGNADVVVPVSDQKAAPLGGAQLPGTYVVDSRDSPTLTFEQGIPYTLVMTTPGTDGEAYGARFSPGAPASIKEFPAASPYLTQPALAHDFTVTRTDGAGSDGRLSPLFYLVAKVDPQRPTATPIITSTNVPQDPTTLLKYVLSDSPYRVSSYTINGATAFASAGYYVVALLAIQQGKVSSNAFLGSIALTGTGAAGLLKVGP